MYRNDQTCHRHYMTCFQNETIYIHKMRIFYAWGRHNYPPASSVTDFICCCPDSFHVSVDTVHPSLLRYSSYSSPRWFHLQSLSSDLLLVPILLKEGCPRNPSSQICLQKLTKIYRALPILQRSPCTFVYAYIVFPIRYLWTARFLSLSFAFRTKNHQITTNAVKAYRSA